MSPFVFQSFWLYSSQNIRSTVQSPARRLSLPILLMHHGGIMHYLGPLSMFEHLLLGVTYKNKQAYGRTDKGERNSGHVHLVSSSLKNNGLLSRARLTKTTHNTEACFPAWCATTIQCHINFTRFKQDELKTLRISKVIFKLPLG